MRTARLPSLLFVLISCAVLPPVLTAEPATTVEPGTTVDLLIVAGQSNAVGYNAVPELLPADEVDRDILFWWRCGDPPPDEHDSTGGGIWTHLQPQPRGNPGPAQADRQYGNFAQAEGGFGPEIGLARTLAHRSDRRIAVVKVAFSGTGIQRDWNPDDAGAGGSCYRSLVSETKTAIDAARAKGIVLRPRAFAWVQGESDANEVDAELYAGRLQRMLSSLRRELSAPGLTALVGLNTRFGTDNKFVPAIVRQQQLAATRDPRCVYVDTSAATNANSAHFDAAGTLDIGRWMAESLLSVEARLNPDRPHLRIVALGDSITKGFRAGVEPAQTFVALAEQQLSVAGTSAQVINAGIGGERTDQGLARLDSIIDLQPDMVTVMYGTNDSYVDKDKSESRISAEAYRENLTRIVVRLLRRGILPILMTEPRWADDARNGIGENPNIRLERYVQACRDIAAEWRVPLVDHFADWSQAREQGISLQDWTTDGCHPNPAGHQRLTALLMQAIPPAASGNVAEAARQKLLSGSGLRVVCFGDSVTGVYYHTGSRRAYTDFVGMALRRVSPGGRVEMFNAGISGNSTVNALERMERDVLVHRPDVVTIMFGLNDMTRVSPDAYRENLTTIIEKCRAAGAEPILVTPNNVITTDGRPTEKLIDYCDIVRRLGQERNVAVCDVYREFDALRADDAVSWRLLMSDEIHPNMDGHRVIAERIAQSISGVRTAVDDVPAGGDGADGHSDTADRDTAGVSDHPAIRTMALLRAGQPVKILAMPPCDRVLTNILPMLVPGGRAEIIPWPVDGLSLSEIREDAQGRVRSLKPDLVLIAVPTSAPAGSDEEFAAAWSWIMNWSLNFGTPTWDCVVVHPSVTSFDATHPTRQRPDPRDDLIRRLVRAQDLPLIDRPIGSTLSVEDLLAAWLARQSRPAGQTDQN